ncbi:hypothetical protein OG698_03000 [Streptomyces sp. NBC_01003]|uniref:hypothetical protein n=1 Tax=Streptomyces sp. NBC_01003 TaxID=2903714 RepID=UPI00387058CE|nr:hypothetical protein OG698_03000 [Streptomyces sp. NBC_01003]
MEGVDAILVGEHAIVDARGETIAVKEVEDVLGAAHETDISEMCTVSPGRAYAERRSNRRMPGIESREEPGTRRPAGPETSGAF